MRGKKKDKIYCRGCQFMEATGGVPCGSFYSPMYYFCNNPKTYKKKDTAIERKMIEQECKDVNSKNNCKYFKKKIKSNNTLMRLIGRVWMKK